MKTEKKTKEIQQKLKTVLVTKYEICVVHRITRAVGPDHTWTNADEALKFPAGQTFQVFGNFRIWNSAPHNRDQSWGIRLRLTLKLGSMQHSLRMNDLLRTLLKRLRHRWTFGLADIEQSSGELVVKKASTTFISTWQNHLRVSFDPEEGNFENLTT